MIGLAFLMRVLRRGTAVAAANKWAALYAFFGIAVFTVIYWLMGLSKHFDVPGYLKGREDSFLTCLYTSALAQSNAMPDTAPKTTVARMLFMAQVFMGWFWFLLFNNPLDMF